VAALAAEAQQWRAANQVTPTPPSKTFEALRDEIRQKQTALTATLAAPAVTLSAPPPPAAGVPRVQGGAGPWLRRQLSRLFAWLGRIFRRRGQQANAGNEPSHQA
jgi:hypothetical protein